MNRQKWILTGLLLVAVLLAIVGPQHSGTAQAQEGVSRVRFLHAVPGAPDVDVYLDGSLVVARLPFGSVTPHVTVSSGDHQVALRPAGSDPASAALVEVPVPLVPNLAFMVVAQGMPQAVQAALYEDILDEIVPGMARLTAINAIADAPALDMLTTAGGPLLQGINYGVQFGTVNIAAGLQDLVFVPAGGSVDGAIAAIGSTPLASGTLYTFVALGTLEGSVIPLGLVLATPVNPGADSVLVRVAHGSPDAPAVDVYANDMLIVPALELGGMTGHIALPAGDYTLALRPAGSAAADPPLASAAVTLSADTPALTIAVVGQMGDGSLAVKTFEDNVAGISAEQARVAVINTVPESQATVTLSDPSATVLASSLGYQQQSAQVELAPGEYMLTVSVAGITNPVDLVVPEQAYEGGTYYSVLVYGGGATGVAYDAGVAGTEIDVTPASLPKPPGAVVVAAQPTETPLPEVVEPAPAPVEATPTLPPSRETELVIDTPTPPGNVVIEAPTEVPPTAVPLVTQPPQPTALVSLNPGARLQCRQYPNANALSLGVIPTGTTLTVIGRTGAPLVPDTGEATPEPTPVVETIEDLWLSVRWDVSEGGYVRCWVAALYLRVEFRGKLYDTLEELLTLPEEPFNRPGEAVNATVSPPTPLYNAVIATVNLDAGVSLQLRRDPKTTAEALDRVPAGAQLEVLGYTVAPSEGLVGQPVDPNWLWVRYKKENGGATIGWIAAQYVVITQLGRSVAIESLPKIETPEAGFYESPGQPPVIPIEQQAVVGVVNLNVGANLNLRDRPSADAFVIRAIPSASTVTINGRNGDGTWVQVTYEADEGKFDGWTAAQYLIITRGGQPYDIRGLPNLAGDPDVLLGTPPAVPPTPTPFSG